MSFNQPLGGNQMPRFGGISTMMRLPSAESTIGLDACFVGVPLDIGTSNRSGTRMGPRSIRAESCLLRPFNLATGAAPFESLQVADVGDVAINTFNLPDAVKRIKDAYDIILENEVVPLTLGGDHTITYPILQAIAQKHGPVALVHIDAHADVGEHMFGERIAHGTTFRRAYEDGLIEPELTFQIGLRGTGYSPDDFNWSRSKGFTVVTSDECQGVSLAPLMESIREKIGDRKVYISFDIDGLDPSVAPGTGTPEIGGLTAFQGQQIIRGCMGLNVIGGDVVEISPPYDQSGNTALLGANLLFEMLCVLPGVKYHNI
ncbi:agmatinase [Pseudomonas ogarae]|uniref:agmatinase n=1 Tax=Pseudomonas ogarae (strain DSM 112162 / CECT 30235 / F113) TaxID=1114970 RepID=UPI0009A46C1B|nr:agmatinase [Pseudomonas ogarae]OPG72056.1 agmatinase [Pseudomonas ogarae]